MVSAILDEILLVPTAGVRVLIALSGLVGATGALLEPAPRALR
jgi:hypothetical protein